MFQSIETTLRGGKIGLAYIEVINLNAALLGLGSQWSKLTYRRLWHLKATN